MAHELGGTEKERQEMVVVQAPDAVGSGWFQVVCRLNLAHELHVTGIDTEYNRPEIRGVDKPGLVKTEQPHHEIQLMSRSIIQSVPRS